MAPCNSPFPMTQLIDSDKTGKILKGKLANVEVFGFSSRIQLKKMPSDFMSDVQKSVNSMVEFLFAMFFQLVLSYLVSCFAIAFRW